MTDPLPSFDAAIAERQEHYDELRHAVAALLYARNKLQARGAGDDELSVVRTEVTDAMKNLARRYTEIQALRRERLRAAALMSAAQATRGRRSDSDARLDSAREYVDQLAAAQELDREIEP